MSDQSFITQIQEAEEQAEQRVADAKSKQGEDLLAYEQKLADDRAKKYEKSREKARIKLKEQQQKAKEVYKDQLQETDRESASIEKNAHERMSSTLSAAEAFLLDLLGVKK